LLTPEQVVLDAGNYTAPVATIEGFVNHSAHFYIHAGAVNDFVIYFAQQLQAFGLLSRIRTKLYFVVSGALTSP